MEEKVRRVKEDTIKELEKAQREAGISTLELARRAGLGQAMVYFWKSGRAFPRLETLVMVADALGKDVEICFVDKLEEGEA